MNKYIWVGIIVLSVSLILNYLLDKSFKKGLNHTYYASRASKKRLIKRFNKKVKDSEKQVTSALNKKIKGDKKKEEKEERKREKREKSKIRKLIKFFKK